MRRSHLVLIVLAGIAAFSQTGCQLMPHSMQPSQLWKWNRQPARDVTSQLESPPGLQFAAGSEGAVELVAH